MNPKDFREAVTFETDESGMGTVVRGKFQAGITKVVDPEDMFLNTVENAKDTIMIEMYKALFSEKDEEIRNLKRKLEYAEYVANPIGPVNYPPSLLEE